MDCTSGIARHAEWATPVIRAASHDWFSQLLSPAAPLAPSAGEVYGEHRYEHKLSNGWVFSVTAQAQGYSVRLYDRPGGVDLSQVNPPLSAAVPNTRDIFGWHFRNADNTAANDGSVNAPQQLRPFEFALSAAEVARSQNSAGTATATENAGRGWVWVEELGLTQLEQGERARANYLKFYACVSWPRVPTEDDAHDTRAHHTGYTPEETEIFGACGLDLQRWQPNALVLPRHLGADFDGDGAHDEVIQVARASGERNIAMCRAGTWLQLLAELDTDPDFQDTINAMERWQVVPRDFAAPGSPGGNTVWPEADGDVLVLERIEKSMYLVYRQRGVFKVAQVYRLVAS